MSKTCHFVLFKSPLCFGFSFNNPGWPQKSISSCRIHLVNTKLNIDHGDDWSAWNFLHFSVFFCRAWTFLLTRRRRLPFDSIKALQIIYIFGTWAGFKLISSSADASARSCGGTTRTQYKYFHCVIKKRKGERQNWEFRGFLVDSSAWAATRHLETIHEAVNGGVLNDEHLPGWT